MRMRAAIFDGPGHDLVLTDIDIQDPKHDEVRVRITAAGICHSDYRVLAGEWGATTPLVLGHEGAGIVESVGAGVHSLRPGDTVALSWTPSCNRCRYCVTGRPQLCRSAVANAYRNVLPDGTTRLSRDGEDVYSYLSVGSFAEYVVVPESGAIRIDPGIDPAVAAIVGCAVTTGVGAAINTRPVRVGESVLVIGAGGVGLSVIMGAALQSPGRLIAVDIADSKLQLAKSFGATDTIDATAGDVVEAVRELTGGEGVDLAFEASGRAAGVEQAYASLAAGGTAVVVGQVATGERISIDPMAMSGRELTLTGSNYGSARPAVDFGRILDLYRRGLLPLDRLVTGRIRLPELTDAFRTMGRSATEGRWVVEFP
ncbi:Zn-dependent alcohol dehydrogenase [Actinoplanes sp. L3-i22]|uniref:Zn-dependent alcohol dehydrogenase n=1 Tax=Actinoplanes sp. L3-i22 TaxID=2836373 RepID=UPI001C79675B|nr:Zn-dependent alcohol dehydrogenase [Actinoplanes sp. L3-i22]BCY10717.1 alcohol dehydrogenase [Actinoplanes sp. L3-i22]